MSTAANTAISPSLLTPRFGMLLIAQASFGFSFSSFFLLPKYLVTELSAGATEVGLMMTAYGAVVVVLVPTMGALVDRFGRRNFLTAGAAVMTLSALAFIAVEEVGPLAYLLRAVQGLAFAMAFTAGAALAVDEAPDDRVAQAIGIFGLTFLSMNAVAPAVVEEVASRAGWKWAFVAAAGGSAICCVLSRRVREHRRRPDGQGASSLWQVASRPSQLRLMVMIALVGAAMCAMFTYHQPFAIELGIANVRAFFVAYAAAAVTVRVGLGRFTDRVGPRRVSIGSLALYAFVVTATRWLEPGALGWFGAGLGVAHGLLYPALNAVAIGESADDERGKVMALFQGAFNVGFAGGAFALGLLADAGGYPAVFLAGGLCASLALGLLVASPEGKGRHSSSPGRAQPTAPGERAN